MYFLKLGFEIEIVKYSRGVGMLFIAMDFEKYYLFFCTNLKRKTNPTHYGYYDTFKNYMFVFKFILDGPKNEIYNMPKIPWIYCNNFVRDF